jgi:hypothetical protein
MDKQRKRTRERHKKESLSEEKKRSRKYAKKKKYKWNFSAFAWKFVRKGCCFCFPESHDKSCSRIKNLTVTLSKFGGEVSGTTSFSSANLNVKQVVGISTTQ